MPCVCRNGHIIRCAEGNRASRNVQKTILHLTALKTVHENAEALQLGTHVHACQRHTIPRLLLELAFVDPPAVDGRQAIDDASTDREFRVGGKFRETNRGYGKLFRHPTAVRRGVGGFRVAQHLHLPVALDKQAETAGRERYDAHVGERTERFWDGLIRRRVVLLSTAGELDVAVDRDDATDATQSETVVRVWRFPCLGYGMLSAGQYEFLPCFLHVLEDAQIGLEVIPCGGLDVGVSELSCDHADVGARLDCQRAERVTQIAWRDRG